MPKPLGKLDIAGIVGFCTVCGLMFGGFFWGLSWRPDEDAFNLFARVAGGFVFIAFVVAGVCVCRTPSR